MKKVHKRIFSSLKIIELNNLNLDVKLNILNSIDLFKNLSDKIYLSKDYEKKQINYNESIIKEYNMSIEEVIAKNIDVTNLIDVKFYGSYLISKFISTRIVLDIINNLFYKKVFKSKNREVVIFSNCKLNDSYINKIDSIFNFFDKLTLKSNKYTLHIFLSKEKKVFNFENDSLDPDNINSGLTLPGSYICIFRKEEILKVLFHELVHYLHLDMSLYQNKFKKLYSDINLKASIVNPNEAYTELLALLFMSMWKYNYYKYYNFYDINTFVSKRLTIELGWSYLQISKILSFFKCYNKYEDLFTNNCEFRQNSNVLSYYILKTYFLQYINKILDFLTIKNLKINYKISNNIFNITNLNEFDFSKNINNVINYQNDKLEKLSLRMTCLD
jgi:hypothetical protein